jgi:hypothetical protein
MPRTYHSPYTNEYFVISKGKFRTADCFSRGFATRAEAHAYRKRLLAEVERTGLTPWQASNLPQMWPDNGRADKEPQPWEHPIHHQNAAKWRTC